MPSPWFVAAAGHCARALAWLALIATVWITLASAAYLWLAGLWDAPWIAPWARPVQWWAHVRGYGGGFWEGAYLAASATLASAPFAVAARFMLVRPGGLGRFKPRPGIVRGSSGNHGHADWMPLAKMQALFPPRPSEDVGGVVVGEADRVDLGPAAGVDFDPDKPATWGNGGKAPLLIDPCKRGSTHSAVIGGSGTYKSTTLVSSLLTWRKSLFCLDPAKELADLVGEELASRGRKVVRLEIGGTGPNVLDGIDIASPMAETHLRAVVGRVIGPIPQDDKGGKFKRWGRTIILALLAHMMWEPTIPRELKTLRALRDGLDGGDEAVRNRLKGIADRSHSALARSLASSMYNMVKETFDGALGSATEDTEWLASGAYADLVSGDAYRMDELAGGNLAVFCQVPLEALQHTPAVARVLVGCHLDAVLRAEGRVNGRVYFPIDEAVLIGKEDSITVALNQGRKCGITLQLFYLSDAQVARVWGADGRREIYNNLSWRTYAGVQDLDAARELSATLGTFGAQAVSLGQNRGKSGRMMEVQSGSRGTSTNEHEISRELAKPHELLTGLRDDERLTVVRNRQPMRHGAAIAFRRPEFARLLGETSYRRPSPAPLEAAE